MKKNSQKKDKNNFLKMLEKAKNSTATPEEKLALLKNLNTSTENINAKLTDLISKMKKEALKSTHKEEK